VAAVSRPPCIEPKARKEEYFGLETEPTSTRRSQLKSQLSEAWPQTNKQCVHPTGHCSVRSYFSTPKT